MDESPEPNSITNARNTLRNLLRVFPVKLCHVLFIFPSSCFPAAHCIGSVPSGYILTDVSVGLSLIRRASPVP